MKKLYFPLAAFALCASAGITSLCITSCSKTAVDNTVAFDSAGIAFDTTLANGTIHYEASFDFPVSGPQPLVDSIRTYLAEVTDYPSEPENGDAMLKHAAEDYLNEHKEWMDGNDLELDMHIGVENMQSQNVILQNDSVITYEEHFTAYEGGAHGTYATTYTTFRKSTGERLTWDIIAPEKSEKLRTELFKRLEAGLRERMQDQTVSLQEIMFEEELSLPSTTPGFTEKGVVFTYLIYELVPYVFGQCSATFSYDEMQQYVKPQYCALLSAQ